MSPRCLSSARDLLCAAAQAAARRWRHRTRATRACPSALALALAGALALACASAPAGTVRYMLWDANQRPLYQQCAQQFQATHPGVRIRILQQGWGDYWTTLSAGFVSETAPDVFTNHLSKYPDLVANGLLLDLTPRMRRDGVETSRYLPGLAQPWQHQGHQYGLPKDWDTVALVVNLDHAQRAGVSEAELRSLRWNPQDGGSFGQVVARLTLDAAGRNALHPAFDKTRVQVHGYQNPGPGGMSGQTEWAPFALSTGFTYQARPWDTALHYDDPRLAATLHWLAGLPARGWSLPPQAMGQLGVDTLLSTGRVAMVPAGAWMIGHYARHLRMRYAWIPMPRGPLGTHASMLNGLADSIWVGSKNPEEAWAWVRHMASAECQAVLADAGAVFPARAELTERAQAAHRRLGADSQAFIDMARGPTFAPPIVENAAEVDSIFDAAIETVLLGRLDATTALRQAQARALQLLQPAAAPKR